MFLYFICLVDTCIFYEIHINHLHEARFCEKDDSPFSPYGTKELINHLHLEIVNLHPFLLFFFWCKDNEHPDGIAYLM